MNEREIFEQAIEIQDVNERQAFLDEACKGNAALRKRLDELLASHDQVSGFLNVPAIEQAAPAARSDCHPTVELPQTARATGAASDQGDDDEDDEAHPAADVSFLQPSQKHGSIGALGHYEILEVLGQGAFGIVFKAFDEKLHRHVAIKAMNPQLASTSPPRKRFLREARSVAAIKHENIVQVYSVEEQPLPYLVMEYIDGLTLRQKLDRSGPLEVPEILHLGRQMAAGLAAAHEKGLIHRDIKPGNILLETGAEQKVKITDFGLARAADDATMTRTGTIAGTPMYMAPEQALGQTLDHRADLFSLGSVLYQMTSGRAPFRGTTAVAVLKRVTDERPRPIQDILPDVPDWLCAIIEKLHAKNPDERFQTAKEVADLLARCQSELRLNGKVTAVSVPAKESIAARGSSPAAGSTDGPEPATARSLGLSIVAVAAVLLLVGGLIVTELTGITSIIRKAGSQGQTVAGGNSQSDAQDQTSQSAMATGWQGWPKDAPPPAIAPFSAEQARVYQETWAKHLGVPVEYTNSIGMKFILIPPGEFTMGSTPTEIEDAIRDTGVTKDWQDFVKSESPPHKVVLTRPIYLGVHEVTQAQYEKVMGQNPSHFAATGPGKDAVVGLDTSSHPVEMVNWADAAEFCQKLSELEELRPFYFRAGETVTMLDGIGYRLPTEAQWEFACRAGTTTKYWSGDKDEDLLQAGWFGVNSGGRTHAVGELKANPFGLFDIHGNVSEWVQDRWEPTYYGQFEEKPAVDPTGPASAGSLRVLRGGVAESASPFYRTSYRHADGPRNREPIYGFRVALAVGDSPVGRP